MHTNKSQYKENIKKQKQVARL